MKTHRDFWLL